MRELGERASDVAIVRRLRVTRMSLPAGRARALRGRGVDGVGAQPPNILSVFDVGRDAGTEYLR